MHGTFVTSTYEHSEQLNVAAEPLGEVRGESCQSAFLYVFPLGSAPQTSEAISDARQQIAGTQYLVDVAIDDRRSWQFGYSVACIVVDAMAYGHSAARP